MKDENSHGHLLVAHHVILAENLQTFPSLSQGISRAGDRFLGTIEVEVKSLHEYSLAGDKFLRDVPERDCLDFRARFRNALVILQLPPTG